MRDLILTENITLDGVIAPMDDWFDPAAQDADLLAVNAEQRAGADALLLGRVTYQEFEAYWPKQVDDPTGISGYLDRVDKYVLSASLDRADWVNTTILRGPLEADVAALKRDRGGDIVVTGSARLAQSLLATGLVDVLRLFVYPVVQGHGRRLFDAMARADFDLVDTRTFRSGVVLLGYRARVNRSDRRRSVA